MLLALFEDNSGGSECEKVRIEAGKLVERCFAQRFTVNRSGIETRKQPFQVCLLHTEVGEPVFRLLV